MALAFGLTGCFFGNSPEKLYKRIEDGDAAKALTVIEDKLADDPQNPALNLLAVKARLALCQQRNCIKDSPNTTPPLLAGLGKHAALAPGQVSLGENTSPTTILAVYQQAMDQYQSLTPQPNAAIAVYAAAPKNLQPQLATGLFQPALTMARRGDTTGTAQILTALGKTDTTDTPLPPTYTYAANLLAAMFTGSDDQKNTNLIALRSAKEPPVPGGAAALIPWAILKEAKADSTAPAAVLETFPDRLTDLNLPNVVNTGDNAAMGAEFLAIANTPAAREQWQGGWSGPSGTLPLALQRMALTLNPNRPDVWAVYLPALVSATLADTTSATQIAASQPLPAATISSASAPQIAAQLIGTAGRLANYPMVATPLVMFASHIPLTKQQQIDLEKMSQSLLIKAAEQRDVTSTLILARTLPGVAQNNRQSVVPLLVNFIRTNLRDGNFETATSTANLLTGTLQMDVEFAPLVLEEFEDDLKRRKVHEELKAETPDMLLKNAADVQLDLGPLFAFMQTYFADQPKVITAQLTTLVAESTGTYGQSTAMYRLGSYFPEATLPAAKQQEWLGASIEQALLADTKLNAVQLADTAAQLAILHPGLNLAPVMEAAIKRATTLEDQRTLWHDANPQVREVLRAIRPEFTMLMQGIDALADNRLNTAAQSFANITSAQWITEAKPFIEQFNSRLVDLAGVYIPVSPAPALKTGAISLAPTGLTGGKLNSVSVTFINRIGTMSETEPATLRTNSAVTRRFSMPVTYDFDGRALPITAQAVAQTPKGGTFGTTFGAIRSLRLQGEGTAAILQVTLADGTSTPFVRTLVDPTSPLRPDGTFAIQSRIGTPTSATLNILPPGSVLTLSTDSGQQALPVDADISASTSYPLTGTLRHPAAPQPISLSGYFEPDTLTSTFLLNYPLPQSAQPARAMVRCQALAGPITCGMHNMNSARQAYATMVTGMQTRESLASSSGLRTAQNEEAATRLLSNATVVIPEETLPTQSVVSGTTGPSATTPVSGSTPSPTTATSSTLLPPPNLPAEQPAAAKPAASPSPSAPPSTAAAPAAAEEEEEEEAPIAVSPTTNRFNNGPEPGAFINNSGSRTTSATTSTGSTSAADSDEPAPGAFINHSGGKAQVTTSPTQP